MFLHSSTEMFSSPGGFAHQKSEGSDWNVRANMCHVQGMLNSDNKKVSCSCQRPNSPTDCDIGSSASSSSVLDLTDTCFGAESPGGVPSVIEAVRAEENLVSASYPFHVTGKFLRSKNLSSQFNLSILSYCDSNNSILINNNNNNNNNNVAELTKGDPG